MHWSSILYRCKSNITDCEYVNTHNKTVILTSFLCICPFTCIYLRVCTQKTDWKTACNNRIKFLLWLLLNYLFISATSDAHTDDWTVFQGQRKIKCFTFLVSKSPLCTWWMPSKHHQHQAGKRQAQARVQTQSSERQVELLTPGQVLSSTGSVRSVCIPCALMIKSSSRLRRAQGCGHNATLDLPTDWQPDLLWETKRKH